MTRSERHPPEECRCLCGQLLARWVAGGIQLKCKRCRRVMTIPFSRLDAVELATMHGA
jgi:phage FluMu protein Com